MVFHIGGMNVVLDLRVKDCSACVEACLFNLFSILVCFFIDQMHTSKTEQKNVFQSNLMRGQ